MFAMATRALYTVGRCTSRLQIAILSQKRTFASAIPRIAASPLEPVGSQGHSFFTTLNRLTDYSTTHSTMRLSFKDCTRKPVHLTVL